MDGRLTAILERVIAATGPDADIDAELHKLFPPDWLRKRGRYRREVARGFRLSRPCRFLPVYAEPNANATNLLACHWQTMFWRRSWPT